MQVLLRPQKKRLPAGEALSLKIESRLAARSDGELSPSTRGQAIARVAGFLARQMVAMSDFASREVNCLIEDEKMRRCV